VDGDLDLDLDDLRRQARWRAAMVAEQIVDRGVADPAVIAAMQVVPRHELVPAAFRDRAYDDGPLPLGLGQTISQPYVVAVMTERAELAPGMRVLEIGTGSGYQVAVLCTLGVEVWSVEIVEPLATQAAADLGRLGYTPHLRCGDGWAGWPEAAPFDAIVVTAAPPVVPPALIDQLAPGGRLVIPVGVGHQLLEVLRKTEVGIVAEPVFPVRFVPMTGASPT
jgi:protein-L-isoaspartate(D-aspartate) O-methyltransferase